MSSTIAIHVRRVEAAQVAAEQIRAALGSLGVAEDHRPLDVLRRLSERELARHPAPDQRFSVVLLLN